MAHPSHVSGAKTLFKLLTFLGIFDPDTNSPANFVTSLVCLSFIVLYSAWLYLLRMEEETFFASQVRGRRRWVGSH